MKRVLLTIIIAIIVLSGIAAVYANADSSEDILSQMDRRDQDEIPDPYEMDSGISIQSAISAFGDGDVPTVRVRLLRKTVDQTYYPSVEFAGANNVCVEIRDGLTDELKATTTGGQSFTIETSLAGLHIPELALNGASFKLVPVDTVDGKISIKWSKMNSANLDQNYRGIFEISKITTTYDYLKIINTISLEEYLYGVVPNEMPGSWPIEALKSQAITARTYSLANIGKHSSDGYELCDSSGCCQAYLTKNTEYYKSTEAVEQTLGQVASYNGNLISTYYSSSTGGYTESYVNWGYPKTVSNPSHLQSVSDPYDLNSANKNGSWLITMTLDELSQRFSDKGIGSVLKVEATQPQTESGRQMEITIHGTTGTYVISGQSQIRSALGFKSAKFEIQEQLGISGLTTIDCSGDTVLSALNSSSTCSEVQIQGMHVIGANKTVTLSETVHVIGYMEKSACYEFPGGGWGHGVGMSQYGAYGMAADGKTATEILQHYYQGIVITEAY